MTSTADQVPASNDTAAPSKKKSEKPPVKRRGYSVEEVCESYGLSRQKVYDEINDGRLHTFKVGNRRIIPQSALDRWESGDV